MKQSWRQASMQVSNSSVARPWKLEQNTSGQASKQASRQASRASSLWKLKQNNMTNKGPFFGPQKVRKSRHTKMGLPSMRCSFREWWNLWMRWFLIFFAVLAPQGRMDLGPIIYSWEKSWRKYERSCWSSEGLVVQDGVKKFFHYTSYYWKVDMEFIQTSVGRAGPTPSSKGGLGGGLKGVAKNVPLCWYKETIAPPSSPLRAPFKPPSSPPWSPRGAPLKVSTVKPPSNPLQAFWRWRVRSILVFGSFLPLQTFSLSLKPPLKPPLLSLKPPLKPPLKVPLKPRPHYPLKPPPLAP